MATPNNIERVFYSITSPLKTKADTLIVLECIGSDGMCGVRFWTPS